VIVRNQQLYSVERDRWVRLLDLGQIPEHRAWPQLLHALSRLLRWIEDERLERLSDYMLSSQARSLADEIEPDLRYAGLRVERDGARGSAYWRSFAELATAALDLLS
jgi:hypothetical protein